jgi:hypothetical protein
VTVEEAVRLGWRFRSGSRLGVIVAERGGRRVYGRADEEDALLALMENTSRRPGPELRPRPGTRERRLRASVFNSEGDET